MDSQITALFTTTLPDRYKIPINSISIPISSNSIGISNILRKILGLDEEVRFEFLVDGRKIHTSLREFIKTEQLSNLKPIEIEYTLATLSSHTSVLENHGDWVSAISGSSKEKKLLTASYDGYLRLYSADTGRNILKYKAHKSPITCLAVHESDYGLYAVTICKDSTSLLWKIESTGHIKLAAKMVGARTALQAVSTSPTEQSCAVGGWDHQLYIFGLDEIIANKTNSGEYLSNYIATSDKHTGCISALTWPSETKLYSGSLDCTLRRWDLNSSSKLTCISTLATIRPITCITSEPSHLDGLVAFGSTDGIIRFWDPRMGVDGKSSINCYNCNCNWLSTVSWCPYNHHLLAIGSYDGSVIILDNRNGKMLCAENKQHNKKVLSVFWLTSTTLAYGGSDGVVKLHKLII